MKIAHIETRECSGIDTMPSLALRTTHKGFCGKNRRPWRGMKESKEEEAGQMDGGPQGDPTRGKKEEKKLL